MNFQSLSRNANMNLVVRVSEVEDAYFLLKKEKKKMMLTLVDKGTMSALKSPRSSKNDSSR